MVRKRVHLQLISKDTSRRRTFRSRKNNLLKKAHEFRTLCGVSTCVIIYDPEDPSNTPETYPEDRNEVVKVIEKYVSTGGKRKMLGLPKFFEDRKKKAENELKKAREDNLKAKYPLPRDLIESLSRDQLDSLCHELTVKIARAKSRLGVINGSSTITMTSDNNSNSNLGVGLNTMESTSKRLRIDHSHLNQLGGEVSWSASNKANSYVKNRLGGISGISMMTTLDNNNNNLGVSLNTMESSSTWPPRLGLYNSHLNQLGGEAACSASNRGNSYMNNFANLPSTQNYSEIPPIQSQYPQYDVSSLGNPNGVGTNYISSGTFCSPPFLQYKAQNNLFMEPPRPLMMHPQPLMMHQQPLTSLSDLAPLPPSTVEWVAEKPASSYNFDQYNYGVYGNADVASSGPPLLPAASAEGQQEHSSSADKSFYSQFF